ncbi:MAG: hypothetical protein NTV34_15795, partial [Proteobacteria bacterium]|nr:hypothetical protein [Pseudomonadota bacterium]
MSNKAIPDQIQDQIQGQIEVNRQTPISMIPGFTMTDRGPEIFGPVDGPLETPVLNIESGHLYMGVEEVMPEVAERSYSPKSPGEVGQEKLGTNILPVDRRDFMKLFSAAAVASTAACVRRPLEKAVPYVNQPVDQAVGVPTYYATTCGECLAGCGITVKTSSGLPIKIEGSAEHPISQGSTCATGQASLQALFHPERRGVPGFRQVDGTINGTNWDDMLETLAGRLKDKKIAIFKGGTTGSANSFYSDVLKKFGGSESDLYSYDANSMYESISEAHKLVFNVEGMPRIDLRLAKTVVGLGSDFLDVGTSPVFFAKNFASFHSIRSG